ncbi:MAG: hypothetical protein AB1746_11210 [Candidatus Zixiibacteriota bacterium]
MIDPVTNTQLAAIVSDGSSFTVAPGQITLYPGDTVTFNNLTRDHATIIFPDERIFSMNMLSIGPGMKDSAVVPLDFNMFGSYPYAIYFPAQRVFAHASMPIIIIYPRKD